MKKIYFLLLLIGSPFLGCGQNTGAFNDVGIIIGPGISTLLGGTSWSPTFGFLLGVETNVYALNEKSSIKAGVIFTMQGANYEDSYSTDYYTKVLKSAQLDGMTYSGKVSLSYIYVPILFNYKIEKGIYFEAGVQPGILISAKDKYNGESYDYKESIKTFDLDVPVGAGYWINDRVSLGARVVFGLPSIDTEKSVDSDEKNHNFMLMGIIRFNFNKEK